MPHSPIYSRMSRMRPLVTARGGADLSSALKSNPSHLRELDLSDNYIKESGIQQLSAVIADSQCKLEKLWLRSCHINEEDCIVLSSALRSNPSHLRELDLSDNYIRKSGVKQLSDLLEHPECKLEKLGLRSCCISESGCADLSSALSLNPYYLRELDLSKNVLLDSGVKPLSDLLKHPHCKLEKLGKLTCASSHKHSLGSCCISNSGCADLSSALILNPSHLRELDLNRNNIEDSGILQLSALLANHQFKLKKLRYVSNYVIAG
ncbi:NACHT, LRR and PYD domains-containing protein 14 [Labeo rohita]|uniref:NACHT, LRR and PYD domains-containing protein 14 n=1 Tax=Labeo rohita TaxID=84645 RepID=A0ABQ8LDB8_LABRO|nr:NACHT, LRR and PYD domains-containing protein 14 [Labeo rohita]